MPWSGRNPYSLLWDDSNSIHSSHDTRIWSSGFVHEVRTSVIPLQKVFDIDTTCFNVLFIILLPETLANLVQHFVEQLRFIYLLFPKQFTVRVLNATWDLAALVLVGVVGFLGSEVVLSPVVSHCLRLSPFMCGVGVGWCGRLLGLWSGLVSRCLRLSPFMWGVGGGWCGRI